jgi:hypothetical protein
LPRARSRRGEEPDLAEREGERGFNQIFKTKIGIKIKRFLEKPFNTQLKAEK